MAVAVVHPLEVVDVRDHERDARTVLAGACKLGVEPVGEPSAIGEIREGVRLHLSRQSRNVADGLRERTGKASSQCRREGERDGGREEDEAPVSLRRCVDRRHRLDGEDRGVRYAERGALSGKLRLAEHDSSVHDAAGRSVRSARDHAAPLDENESCMGRQRRRLPHERKHVVAKRYGDRHAREYVNAVVDRGRRGDPGARSQDSGRMSADHDPRMLRASDRPESALVLSEDRALE